MTHEHDMPERLKYEEAMKRGYVALTRPYALTSKCLETRQRETRWFHNVLDDMNDANIVIVEFAPGVEIWRHRSELNVDSLGRSIGSGTNQVNMSGARSAIRAEKKAQQKAQSND